jgi:hypothetical protein
VHAKETTVGIGAVADELKLSVLTVTVALDHLVRLGIAKEITGKRRARIFGYSRYLKIQVKEQNQFSISSECQP